MKKYIIYALVAFAFTLSSCADSKNSTSPNPMAPESSNLPTVSANAAQTGKYDINWVFWNPCCNEYITFTGTAHYTYKNGKYHFNVSNFKGVGSSGNTYNGQYNYNYSYNFNEGADVYTYQFKEKFTSSTTGCSFTLTYKLHYVWDKDGNLVVDKYDYEFSCD